MINFSIVKKFTAAIANLSLLLNSFLPFILSVKPIYAEDNITPTPTPTQIVEVSPTPQVTPTVVEVSPTPEITVTPQATPTAEISPTPEITPEVTPEVTITPTPEITVTPETTPTPIEETEEVAAPTSTPTPTSTLTPSPTPAAVKQICLTDQDSIRDSIALDWNYNSVDDFYETRERVQLGVKYIFPQENNVTVTFKCLPEDESLRTNLKIKKVKTSDLKLPENINNVGEYAYDITTGMFDGDFKYDITLPKSSDSTAEISYIEKSLDQAKENISTDEIKSIDNIEQQTDSIKAKDVDHFTIYLVYMFNSAGASVVDPSKPDSNHQITICHDNNGSKDYREITVDDNSILKDLSGPNSGHNKHLNDIIPSFKYGDCPSESSGLYNSDDTSKPCKKEFVFGWHKYFKYADYINVQTYPGKNWTPDNQLILNNDCKTTGKISITKETNPDHDGGDFDFIGGLGDFNLHDDETKTSEKTPGMYTIFEAPKTGWRLTDIQCTGTDSSNIFKNLTNQSVTINLKTANDIRCTFTNSKLASVHGYKWDDQNNNGIRDQVCTCWFFGCLNWEYTEPTLSGWDIQLKKDGSVISTDTTDPNYGFNNLDSGDYELCEVPQSGWTNICQSFHLNTGEDKEINFGNRRLSAGVIKVQKIISPTATNYSDFSFSVNSNTPVTFDSTDGINEITANVGTNYTITETPNSNYQVSYDGCENISVNPGETKICTITNTKLSTITIIKDAHPNDNQDFQFNGGSLGNFSLDDDDDATLSNTKTFTVIPGHYSISESTTGGWELSDISCSGRGNLSNLTTDSVTNHNVAFDLGSDASVTCTFHNYKQGSIEGYKYNDYNNNGSFDESSWYGIDNWRINLYDSLMSEEDGLPTPIQSVLTSDYGKYNFINLSPKTYYVCEEKNNSWIQTQPIVGPSIDSLFCYQIDLTNGQNVVNKNFGNFQKGSVMGCKYNDINGSGIRSGKNTWEGIEEPQMNGWTIRLYNSRWQKIRETVTNPYFYFNNIMTPGDYYLCEQMQPGWTQTEPLSGENYGYVAVANQSGDNTEGSLCKKITINQSGFSGSHYYSFGNQRLEPKATITKSNNTTGDLSPGDSVEYKIKLTISDNDVTNFKVTDLLSNGFKYRNGSYKIISSLRGDITESIAPPTYNSPGVWHLGDLQKDEELTLTYIADISTDQQAGKYADIAWASGKYAYDSSKTVLALAANETNFANTQVSVNKNSQNSVSAEVEKTNHISGQVLGASTELPGTGASTIWLVISGLMGIIGLSLLKFNKKFMLTILLTLLSFGFLVNPVNAQSSNLSIILEEPKTPSNIKDIELKFVALDIQGRSITVQCLKKGPNDSGFNQFGSNIALSAGGNSSHCSLNSAINDNGSYQFQVKAIADTESVYSQIVNLDYKTSTPGTPTDYRKEQINSCDFKIHFKTADDSGKTVKVEIYRSTDSNFSANNESLVHSISIGSNQEKDINSSVSDCSKKYYYALRAFDDAGNGSGLIGDSVYKDVIDNTITNATPTTGAIPVTGSNISSPETNGEEISSVPNSTEETGQVLGVENTKQSFFVRHKIISGIIILSVLAIILYVLKKNIGKKSKKRRNRDY